MKEFFVFDKWTVIFLNIDNFPVNAVPIRKVKHRNKTIYNI